MACALGTKSGDETPLCNCGPCQIVAVSDDNLRSVDVDLASQESANCFEGLGCMIYTQTCDECYPDAISNQNTAFPGGIGTFRTYGCKQTDNYAVPGCNLGTIQVTPGNPNNCECCSSTPPYLPPCHPPWSPEGGGLPFWDYDDVPDGITDVSPIYRCRRRLLNNLCCDGSGPVDPNSPIYSVIRVRFYSPGPFIKKRTLYQCVESFPGAGDWHTECFDLPNIIVPGQSWTCHYALEQQPCQWFATGAYRLVRVETNCAMGGTAVDPNSPCGNCGPSCPTGERILCDWNGVNASKLESVWEPPPEIFLSRIQ